MAIVNIQLPPLVPGMSSETFGTDIRTGTLRNAVTGVTTYDENDQINVSIAQTAAGEIQGIFPRTNGVATVELQAQGGGTGVYLVEPLYLGDNTDTHQYVDFRVIEVRTVETVAGVNAFQARSYTFTPAGADTPGTYTINAAGNTNDDQENGFVQAIFTGNELATNFHKDGLIVSFGPATNTTTYRLANGVALPTGAVITNNHEERFNIIVNTQ